jgi:23S rRNA pseudouridine1911/1915/1917 synthase
VTEHLDPIVVPSSLSGERVDRALALITGWSRAAVADLVAAELVLVDGRPVTRSRRLTDGELVEVLGEPAATTLPVAEDVPLDVRHADDDVVVLAKPAGIVVHPGPGHDHGTLVHGLLARFPEIAAVGDPLRPGIVHRLDRDTSGLMLVARSPRAYTALVDALARREIERRYVALVLGVPESPRGVIDAPIGRSTRRRTRMAVRAAGRDARTGYEVVEELGAGRYALLACTLDTGRTHQIRVHLAAIGHPVVGDPTYGGRRLESGPDRPFLHAGSLAFDHPISGEALRFEDPLPAELEAALARLRDEASLGGSGAPGEGSDASGEAP